jgi:AcrR family transcriptional regulator
MRRIADALGAGTMTLYYYVRTREDLLVLIDDALLGEVVARSEPLPRQWRAAVGKLARATRETFARHPWALKALAGAQVGPNFLRHIEQSLTALAGLEADVPTKLALLSIVDDYVFGTALRVNETMAGSPLDPKIARAMNATIKGYLASGDYPRLRAMIGDLEPVTSFTQLAQQMNGADHFEVGLEALLDGLTAKLRLREPSAQPRILRRPARRRRS